MIKTKFYTFLFLLTAITMFGQQKQLETRIDSAKIKIGSQFNLILKATVDTSARVNFPEGKNFGQLEVLESYPVDTVKKGAMYELVKKYGLTQFDSGRYVIPPLPVIINNKNIKSDSLVVEVANIKVDTLKQKMYDIKAVIGNESASWLWLYIVLGVLALAGIGYGIYWYIKKRKKQPKKEEVIYTSPIEKATIQLQNLEKEELLQRGEVKDYYSRLTDIARTYIEEAIHVPAMESTTTELIEAMRVAVMRKKMNLSQETFEQLERVLRTADMVKFAKSRPLDFEIAEDRSRIQKTIVVIDRSIPEEVEEEDHNAVWLEMQRKKKLKKRRTLIIAVSAGVLILALAIFGIKTAINKSGVFGVPTKELLEGEWVKSDYGNPGVTIETPRVLKRVDAEKLVPKDAMAFIKDMQMFTYGTQFDDMFVLLGTVTYKQSGVDMDLNLALDGVVKTWEAEGVQNILLKTEEFQTPNGITGIRSYGTMSMPHAITKKPVRAYYELYFFKQEQGLQQVQIVYKEGDEYAPQILERIKNSIELRKAI